MKVFASIVVVTVMGHLCSAQAPPIGCPIIDCVPGTYTPCLIDPCSPLSSSSSCPLYPDATCCSNYCGGCFSFFVLNDGTDVTDLCAANPNCSAPAPAFSPGGCDSYNIGCRNDDECSGTGICCSSSCGTSCQEPVDPCATVLCALPVCEPGYTTVVPEGQCCPACQLDLSCPDPSLPVSSSSSTGDSVCPQECSAGSPCSDSAVCCQTDDCETVCLKPQRTCTDRRGRVLRRGESFVKDNCTQCVCGEGGNITCTTSCTQFCEAPDGTRVPVGGSYQDDCNTCFCSVGPSGGDPVAGCTEIACAEFCEGPNGTRIPIGDSFDAADGCNTCTCAAGGVALCTLRFCIDRCHQPQDPGDCDAAISRYWFDQTTGVCRQFTWGGCGGNMNRFRSIEDCLSECNPESTCLAGIYPNNQQPLCLIASQRRWTFNVESGECEELDYIPCQSSEGFNVYESAEECENRCIGGDDSECPLDLPIVSCFVDPCQYATCSNFPNAKCRSNYCGGCNAWFFDEDGTNVTEQCSTGPVCDDGTPIVSCFADPCVVNSCPNFREARCEANYCGGCHAWYFTEQGNNVTDFCRNTTYVLPTPLEYLQCPPLQNGTVGICVEGCTSHSDCEEDLLCCSNGCGRSCRAGDSLPYYKIPTSCPPSSPSDFLGTCQITDDSCLSDSECEEEDELCCRSGCGRTCQTTVTSPTPCSAIVDDIVSVFDVTFGLVGVYVPQCLEDGSFAPTQCHEGFCWCVNTRTGIPTSPRSPRGTVPVCITCETDTGTYFAGQSFPSSDGCNTCFCSDNGAVACTRRACPPTGCNAPPDTGPCRGAFPAYYFDPSDGTCKSFTYGGCGGNDNKFKSVGDCLRRCNNESLCLQPPVTGLCEAFFPSYFYNSTSGSCDPFVYGGCGGNENRFGNGRECVEACDENADYEENCLGILCDAISCPPGSGFVSDGSCCGGFCSEIECSDDERMCRDGSGCVALDYMCDIIEDCEDGSDESDCPDPPSDCENGFQCGTQECIPNSYVCDDYVDCRDRSDEQGCSTGLPRNTQFIRDIPRQCPDTTDRLVDCEDESCRQNRDCEGPNQLCCPTSCDESMCILGVPIVPRCSALRRILVAAVNASAFIPDCERDGTFSPTQCHRGYCWCVDIQDGYPLTEGVSDERPNCRGCQVRDDDPSSVIPFGETYSDQDGCNICYCTAGYPEEEHCTNDRCPVGCRVDDVVVAHEDSFEDDCIRCECSYGALKCERRLCVSAAPIRSPTQVTMPFSGDFDSIVTDDKKESGLKREVTRTLLSMYRDSLKLKQEQIGDITVRKGSVIVIVEFSDSANTTQANLTVFLSQLEQDFMNGVIVIRFGDSVLEPSGEFQTDTRTSAVFQPWVIAVIVVAAVAVLIAVIAVIIAVVACCRKGDRGPRYSGKASPDYDGYDDRVAYTKTEDTIKVPLD